MVLPTSHVQPLWFVQMLKLWEKYSWTMENALKSNEIPRIWVHKTFKVEIKNGGPNNSDYLQNWFPSEITSPIFNLYKVENSDKSTPELCRMHWNLMNDEYFRSIKLLKLKCRRGDQIIQSFCRIGSPQKLGPPFLICRNFKTLRTIFLNHAECIEI